MGDNKDVIIGEISTSIGKLLGSSASAVMRTAGRSASLRIWPELPSGKSLDEAGAIMTEGVAQLGGFGDFHLEKVNDDTAKIEFRNCFFASFTKDSGKPCGEQPVCHFGFGLVEETLRRLTGKQMKVELVRHDDVTVTCYESAKTR